MKLKIPILFFLVFFPVCIYLFLQTFGENEFLIPDLGEASELNEALFCREENSSTEKIDFKGSDFKLIEVINKPISKVDQYNIDLNRIEERFDGTYSIVSIYTQSASQRITEGKSSDKIITVNRPFLSCLGPLENYLISEELNENLIDNNWFILIDNNHKIKSFYLLEEPKDIDRLVIELALLLDKK
ncbi:MAG: hypothetical protein AAF363_21550 [Bacteroidota bacterium]